MTKKILLLFFLFLFFIILFKTNCSAFNFKESNNYYDFGDIEILNYTFAYYYKNSDGSLPYIVIYTFENEPYFKTVNFYEYLYYLGRYKRYMFYTDSLEPYSNIVDSTSETPKNINFRSDMIDVIIYSDFNMKNDKDEVLFKKTSNSSTPVTKFFNFRYGTLDYSFDLTNISLFDYIAVFKLNNIAVIYTSKDHPIYKYKNKTHYMCSSDFTAIYGYNFSTDKVILDDYIYKYSETGLDMAFKKEQLIYSNFVLYDSEGIVKMETVGSYLGDGDLEDKATGNFVSGGSQNGNSLLDDYIESNSSDYKGSAKNGSDVVGGGFSNIYNNFGFSEDIKNNINSMVDVITNTKEAPKFLININSKYYNRYYYSS